MNLDHLKYFCDAVRLNSLKESARVNNISPGAVSQAIQKLEEYFNAELLFHKKGSMEATESGVKLLNLGQNILEDFKELKSQLNEDDFTGELEFATQQSLAQYYLAEKITKFKKKYEMINIKMTMGTTDKVKESVENRQSSFGITLANIDLTSLNSKLISQGNFVCYKGNYKKKDHLFLTTELTSELSTFLKSYKKIFKRDASILMQVSSWGVIKSLADKGQGIAIIPDYLLDNSERKKILKLNENFKMPNYTIELIWPKNRKLGRISQLFLEFI